MLGNYFSHRENGLQVIQPIPSLSTKEKTFNLAQHNWSEKGKDFELLWDILHREAVTVCSLMTEAESFSGWVTIYAIAACAISSSTLNKNTSIYPATLPYEKLPIQY